MFLAEDLRAALAFFPQDLRARRPRTDAPSRPSKRTRRRRAGGAGGAARSGGAGGATVAGAAGGAARAGDGQRRPSRRRQGAHDPAAGASDPEAPTELVDPAGVGDDDIGDSAVLSEPEPDVVDDRPEGERGYAVWCGRVRGEVLFLCSCGGRGGAESVEMRTSIGLSSTCCHARALKASVVTLTAAAGLETAAEFLDRFPHLDNGAGATVTDYTAHFATKTSKNRGVFAVQSGGAWAVVVIRPRMGKSRSKKRQQMRAACTQLSCAKDHWWCPHAAAVTEWCTELRATTQAANEMGGNFNDPFRDVHLPEAAAERASAPAVPPDAAADAAFADELVPYDGASESLFASTTKTVFTRTFMDVITQMVFTGHSTLSSAAAVLCFLLEVSKSLSGASSVLARQTVIAAVHRYARTLIVPASLFRCTKCKVDGDRPYWAVIADGEVLSILRSQSQPLFRVTEDVRVVPIDTNFASVLPVASLRAAIRKALTSERMEAVRLSKTEFSALRDLGSSMADTPAPRGPGVVVASPMTLQWAASLLFFSFFSLSLTDQDPPPATEDGANVDGDNDGDAEAAGTSDSVGGRGFDVDATQAAFSAPIAAGVPTSVAGGVGGEPAAPLVGAFPVALPMADAVGTGLPAVEMRERWRTVRRFLSTFLGQPLLGALAGLDRVRIRALAVKIVRAQQVEDWRRFAVAVESVGILWPFLRLVGMGADTEPLVTRAIAELLLYACDVDALWESEWRRRAPPSSTEFESQWREVSPAKLAAHVADRPGPPPASRRLGCTAHSLARADAQVEEVRSGQVWPDLEPVRAFITDGKADAVNAARASKVGADRETLRAMAAKELGEDDCRHKWLTSETFMPGIENFLCLCGLLIGYDFLDKAESPSHVLASLVQRFPLLPKVVYFDTACQLARNAARRVPWLVNESSMACSLDRPHNVKHQHKCSRIFDADAYPSRSVRHSTACAESRHSINKAYKTHLAHLRQDHFIIQMRLLAATINLRVKMRRELRKETSHRQMCAFFHSHVQDYCDRRCCTCAAGLQQAAAAAEAVDAADGGDDGDDNDGGGRRGGGGQQVGLADAAAEVTAAAPVAPLHPVHVAVADALPVVVAQAVDSAAQEAGLAAGQAAGHVFGRAAGLAAVQATYHVALEAGVRDAGAAAGEAAAAAAGQCAALFPVQATIQAAVTEAVLVKAAEVGQRSARAAVGVVCGGLGHAAGFAAARAADAAAGRPQPAADGRAAVAENAGRGEQGAAHKVDGGVAEQRREGQGVEGGDQLLRTDDAGGEGLDQLGADGVVSGQAAVRAVLRSTLRGLGVVVALEDPTVSDRAIVQDNGHARKARAAFFGANVLGQESSDSQGAVYSGGEASEDEDEV
ncbi:hypothetical protein BU14_0184s0028 [Porphyra umbilicalis]|uniref:Uncharacterized protein n=1 Tax=Porphyra umbilicalis TaxID=2786 RepID=A0A1X6P6T2_PORUM|nr:hypothetical protein BU14_0184s0028 [Porphyra umbilicalis]|eukprot:OSX76601.1 hypothetical protein BU14_0184s0028 [Porphyra umbilicalis]